MRVCVHVCVRVCVGGGMRVSQPQLDNTTVYEEQNNASFSYPGLASPKPGSAYMY